MKFVFLVSLNRSRVYGFLIKNYFIDYVIIVGIVKRKFRVL